MRTLSLVIALTLAAHAGAQSAPFEIYPGTTSLTSRGALIYSAGEVHQSFLSRIHRGLGENGSSCSLSGVTALIQDQRPSTPNLYGLAIRSGTDTSGPLATPAGLLYSTGLVLPMPPSTLTTPFAWTMTTTWVTPIAIPCDSFLSVGIELEAAPLWTTDGLSIHMANGTGLSPTQQAHPSTPDMAWAVVGTSTTLQPGGRSYRIAPWFRSVFQAANVDTIGTQNHFGTGGYFPDTTLTGTGATSQGLAFRCEHPGGAAATAYVLGSIFGLTPSPFTVLSIGNRCHLDLNGLFPFVIASGPADGTVIPFVAAGLDKVPSASGLTLGCQALVANPTSTGTVVEFVNAVGIVLL